MRFEKESISRKHPVLPFEKFLSFVLPKGRTIRKVMGGRGGGGVGNFQLARMLAAPRGKFDFTTFRNNCGGFFDPRVVIRGSEWGVHLSVVG